MAGKMKRIEKTRGIQNAITDFYEAIDLALQSYDASVANTVRMGIARLRDGLGENDFARVVTDRSTDESMIEACKIMDDKVSQTKIRQKVLNRSK